MTAHLSLTFKHQPLSTFPEGYGKESKELTRWEPFLRIEKEVGIRSRNRATDVLIPRQKFEVLGVSTVDFYPEDCLECYTLDV